MLFHVQSTSDVAPPTTEAVINEPSLSLIVFVLIVVACLLCVVVLLVVFYAIVRFCSKRRYVSFRYVKPSIHRRCRRDANVESSWVASSAVCTEFATSWRQFRRVWTNLPTTRRAACECTRRQSSWASWELCSHRRRRSATTRKLRRVGGV